VASDDKRYARIKVLRTLCERLENQLNADAAPAEPSDDE